MAAKSKSQQRYFGMISAYQEGKLPAHKLSKKQRETAKNMDPEKVDEFAETKHKGLPEKKASMNMKFFKKLIPKKKNFTMSSKELKERGFDVIEIDKIKIDKIKPDTVKIAEHNLNS
jgi:hypothetical protein